MVHLYFGRLLQDLAFSIYHGEVVDGITFTWSLFFFLVIVMFYDRRRSIFFFFDSCMPKDYEYCH